MAAVMAAGSARGRVRVGDDDEACRVKGGVREGLPAGRRPLIRLAFSSVVTAAASRLDSTAGGCLGGAGGDIAAPGGTAAAPSAQAERRPEFCSPQVARADGITVEKQVPGGPNVGGGLGGGDVAKRCGERILPLFARSSPVRHGDDGDTSACNSLDSATWPWRTDVDGEYSGCDGDCCTGAVARGGSMRGGVGGTGASGEVSACAPTQLGDAGDDSMADSEGAGTELGGSGNGGDGTGGWDDGNVPTNAGRWSGEAEATARASRKNSPA